MASRPNAIRPRPAAYVRRNRIGNVVTIVAILSLVLLTYAISTGTIALAYLGLTVQHGDLGALAIASTVVALPLYGAFRILRTILWYGSVIDRPFTRNR